MSVWRGAVAALLAAGLLVLAACASGSGQAGPGASTVGASVSANSSDTTVPPAPNLARFYRQQLDWHGCGDGFQCTRLLVPLDYAHPRAGTLKIAVNRLPRLRRRGCGSLLVNPGGPGASGRRLRPGARRRSSPRRCASATTSSASTRAASVRADPLHCLTDRRARHASSAYDGTPGQRRPRSTASQHQARALARRLRGATTAHAAGRTSAPVTPPATWTCCGPRSATGEAHLPRQVATAPTSARPTRGCSPTRVGRLVLDGAARPGARPTSTWPGGRRIGLPAGAATPSSTTACAGRPARSPATAPRPRPRSPTSCSPSTATRCPASGGRTADPVARHARHRGRDVRRGQLAVPAQRAAQALRGDGDGRGLMLLADYYTDRGPGGHYTSNANEVIYAVNCVDRPQDGDIAATRADAAASREGVARCSARTSCGATCPAPPGRRRRRASPRRSPRPVRAPILVVGHDARPGHALRVGAGAGRAAERRAPADLRRRRPHGVPAGEHLHRPERRRLLAARRPACRGHPVPLSRGPARCPRLLDRAGTRCPAPAALAQSARATHS